MENNKKAASLSRRFFIIDKIAFVNRILHQE